MNVSDYKNYFFRKHSSEYEVTINFLAKLLFEPEILERCQSKIVSTQAYFNVIIEKTLLEEIGERLTTLNILVMNKIYQDVIFLINNSTEILEERNVMVVNEFFNRYYRI